MQIEMIDATDLSDCVSFKILNKKKQNVLKLINFQSPDVLEYWQRFVTDVCDSERAPDGRVVTPYYFIRWICGLIEKYIEDIVSNVYRKLRKLGSTSSLKDIAGNLDLNLYRAMFLYAFSYHLGMDCNNWINDVIINYCTFQGKYYDDRHTVFLYNILLESRNDMFKNYGSYESRDGTVIYREFNNFGSFNELFVIKGSNTPGLRQHVIGLFHIRIAKPLYFECLYCDQKIRNIDASMLSLNSSVIDLEKIRDYFYPRDQLFMAISLNDSQVCKVCRCVF